ncbi:MAG: BON domain-containing protein [Gammaproteobacteria bacterium]|nr:BON domain-containing protein [Gammaproteobacteria bacterium]
MISSVRLLMMGVVLLLTGCVAALLAGTATGVMVYDGRGGVVLERDARIFHLINTTIATDPRFRYSRISVTSFNQVVLLIGQTPAASLRVLAEKIAKRTPRVTRVYNEVTIGEPINLAMKAKDTWITGEVRTQMLARRGLESGSIRIVTENGIVYLMGLVSREQANLAGDVARHVRGVRRVVKIFQYMN